MLTIDRDGQGRYRVLSTGGRRGHCRCYGKYPLQSRARQRLRQILVSQTSGMKPKAIA